ncbi:MAG: hypothetical protein QM368_08865 [Bacillota bacterium]|nr:hypothetical protein [Bacillota bacterium]HHU30567.1 hypothetical protein [Bacillota bacterium]
MKKVFVPVVCLLMLLPIATGCGVKEKISREITEGIINKVTDGADIDLNEGAFTITGEDGEKLTIGSAKWPEDQAAAMLPKLNKGEIASVMNSADACIITINDISEKDYDQYVKTLEKEGFVNDAIILDEDNNKSYFAYLDDKATVAVSYYIPDKFLTISLEKFNE